MIQNFRDLRGHTKDQRQLKPGRLYRSASLFDITKADIERLKMLGIRHVIDVRSPQERNAHPYELPQEISVHHVPAMYVEKGLTDFYFLQLITAQSSCEDIRSVSAYVRNGYTRLPFQNPAFQTLLTLMEKQDGAILFHCSSGKDRTGVLAALILKLMDVQEDEILSDYLQSNAYCHKEMLDYAQTLHFDEARTTTLLECCCVHEQLLASGKAAVLTRYPSWDAFFTQEYGLDEERRRNLRQLYLSDKGEHYANTNHHR